MSRMNGLNNTDGYNKNNLSADVWIFVFSDNDLWLMFISRQATYEHKNKHIDKTTGHESRTHSWLLVVFEDFLQNMAVFSHLILFLILIIFQIQTYKAICNALCIYPVCIRV